MAHRLAFTVFTTVAVTLGLAAGAVFAQDRENPGAHAPGSPSGKARDWWDLADIALRSGTLAVLAGGLVGTFAVLTALRSSAYSQIFSRFQSLLLKLVEHPELFERMKREEYTDAENDPAHPETTTHPHRFLANCMVNLYEEAFLLYESRVLSVIDPLPRDYWESILGSMRAAFQLKYVRTHWEKRQAVFSPKFNRFVRDQILGFTGVNPAPDVV